MVYIGQYTKTISSDTNTSLSYLPGGISETFLDILFSLKPEKAIFNDCRIVSDTIIDGKLIATIEDFYMITDLENETITIKKGEKNSSASYLAPRYALRYCKNNENRLVFVRASDRLLKIK